jgi:DNA (cytosine-5)-methyltransferase 1
MLNVSLINSQYNSYTSLNNLHNSIEDFTPRFIDLFAGIGGFHIGMKEAGATCVFASEWDVSARATYEENFKYLEPELFESGNFAGDITTINPLNIPDFDILCGGFPCQPFSNAGFKKGFNDKRGNLFFNIAEIIRAKKPEAFFLENVRGLINHDSGNTFRVIQKILKDDLGYSFYSKIVYGTDYGVPQFRPRVYIVGFKNPDIAFNFPEKKKLNLTLSDILGGHCERKIGFTLRCGGRGSGVNDRRNWDCYIVDGREIKIGTTEGKKLQGLPDSFTFPVSETQAMKQLGNSVVVPAIAAVGKEIVRVLYGN